MTQTEISIISNNNIGTRNKDTDKKPKEKERQQWNNQLEFLLSCIAMSVGVGNVWRFPYTAYENGGGAFLIPYLIVMFLVGKPIYFLELALGQFVSGSALDCWTAVPLMTGIGYGQSIACYLIGTINGMIMALCLHYLYNSFSATLPWSVCGDWATEDECYSAADANASMSQGGRLSSSELYFERQVLHMWPTEIGLSNGLGPIDGELCLALAVAWAIIYFTIVKGVQGSGRIAYFSALFPYVVLAILLVRGVTLPGAWDGIYYFFKPDWSRILEAKVWFAAITQNMFSLGVGFGIIPVYASFNPFRHNVYTDSMVISIMDALTCLIAGVTIFSILGNLAYMKGETDIGNVVKGGAGLAFISYPEALAKFDKSPQVFSVLFFLMMVTLGIGSVASYAFAPITTICDLYPSLSKFWVTTAVVASQFLLGLVYTTPGGQYLFELNNWFSGNFVIFILAALEIIIFAYVYGARRFASDVEFMTGVAPGFYWQLCWGIVTPGIMGSVLVFFFITLEEPMFEGDDYEYPRAVLNACWIASSIAIGFVPIVAIHRIYRRHFTHPDENLFQLIANLLEPSAEWGPDNKENRQEWNKKDWPRGGILKGLRDTVKTGLGLKTSLKY